MYTFFFGFFVFYNIYCKTCSKTFFSVTAFLLESYKTEYNHHQKTCFLSLLATKTMNIFPRYFLFVIYIVVYMVIISS